MIKERILDYYLQSETKQTNFLYLEAESKENMVYGTLCRS
jgi:hypothetical protein